MEQELFPVGTIVGAHGVRGEVKLFPDRVEPEYLIRCKTFYLDGLPLSPTACRPHKGCLLLTLPGVGDMDAALALKGRTLYARREDIPLPQGVYLDRELVGLRARDEETGEEIGTLEEVLSYPAHKVYAIRGGKDEYLVPAVPAFIKKVDLGARTVTIHLLEGLGTHEN